MKDTSVLVLRQGEHGWTLLRPPDAARTYPISVTCTPIYITYTFTSRSYEDDISGTIYSYATQQYIVLIPTENIPSTIDHMCVYVWIYIYIYAHMHGTVLAFYIVNYDKTVK